MAINDHRPVPSSKIYWTLAGYAPRFPRKSDPYFQITGFSILEGSLVSVFEFLAVIVFGIWSSDFVLGSVFQLTWNDASFKLFGFAYLIALHLLVGTPLMLFYWNLSKRSDTRTKAG